MTVRKNFVFDEATAHTLEEIAKEEGITQTEAVKRAIEELQEKQKRKKRLEALEKLAGSLTGKIGNIDAKEAKKAYILEKYGY